MWPDIVRTQDSRRRWNYTLNTYIFSGNSYDTIKSVPGSTRTKTSTTSDFLGQKREFWGARSGRWRPNIDFRLGLVRHFGSSRHCTNATAKLQGLFYGKLCTIAEYSGPLACFANPTSFGSWDYLYGNFTEDPTCFMRARARSHEGAAQALVTLGELPETLAMLVSPMKAIRKLATKPRKVNGRKILDPTSRWLEARYGILPLMGEIDTYRNLYDSKLDVDYGPILKSRAGNRLDGGTIPSTSFVTNSNLGIYFHGYYTVERHTTMLSTDYTRTHWTSFQNLGVDASSILPALYELVPYSFVLDWVYDVGTWLRASLPKPGVTYLGSLYSTKMEEIYTVNTTGISSTSVPSEQNPISPCNSTMVWNRTTYDRTAPSPLPDNPVFKINMSSLARQIDAVSLAFQQAKRALR